MKELLERERELAAVEELLGRRSGVLIIEVGVGIGKTSLVQAACRQAQELGYDVLSAQGSELEADFAFGVVRQLFERRLTAAGADGRARYVNQRNEDSSAQCASSIATRSGRAADR